MASIAQKLARSVIAFVLVFGCSNLFASANDDSLILRLKWFHQFQFAGYYAALEKGCYSEEGLNVVIKQRDTGKNPLDEVVTGEVDFGISDSSLILKRLNGSPVVALAVIMQSSPLVLMSLDEKQVTTPFDLIGKRIMYQENVDDAIIMGVLNEFNIERKDFSFVPHNFDDQALINDHADVMSAYITNQPYTYRTKGLAINIINPANYGVDFYGDNLFTSERMLNEHAEQVLAFRRASIKGWKYALDNIEETVDLIITKYGSKKSREALIYEANMTKRMIKPRLIEIGDINPSRFKRISEIYKEKGLVPLDADLKGFHYLDYMAKSNSLMTLVIVVSSILALLTIVLMFVILINNRLKQAVKTRTENLAEANLRLKKLIGFVAHDLRNPLGAILSFSKLAQNPRYKERLPQILENIGASAAKGLELVKSALETTALGTGKFELEIAAFDLREAIELSVESFMTIANGKDVSFNVEVPENTKVDADKNRIIQVLDNIILNAIKYSSDSSVIHVQAITSENEVEISCTNDVPQGYQVEAEEEGLYRSFGFGIEIIREILELHRSKLELYSNDSEFVVKFTLEKA